MASLNSDNVIKNVSGEEKPAPASKKPKKNGKNNNQVYILIGLILFCIAGGYFLFGGGSSEAGDNLNQAAATDGNASQFAPPPPPPANITTQEQNLAPTPPAQQPQEASADQGGDMFNQSAIDEALHAPTPAERQEQEQKQDEQEQQSLGKWTSAPRQELQQRPTDAAAAQQQEQNIKNTFEARLESLKNNIVMKVNFFSYGGKNYYEGDKILDFKIKEVTKTKVTLQDVDKKLTILNFGSK